jgi:diguanylate cyclase (GGDEF)-like protein
MAIHPEQFTQGTLLIVGDIPDHLAFFCPLLQDQGYDVYHTDSPEGGIEMSFSHFPHLIILSTALQEPDSYTFCQEIKKIDSISQIPVLFLILNNTACDPWKIYQIGGADYLGYPFHPEEMLTRIQHQMTIAKLQKRLERQSNQLERTLEDLHKLETYMAEVYDELREFSFYDALTKVANRRRFEELLEKEWRRAARDRVSWGDIHQTALSLILANLDCFRDYNERLGTDAGDRCLQQIAEAIQGVIKRPADLVARYSGETFAILLPYTTSEGALQVANLIRLEIEELKISHPNSKVSQYVTLSFGVATGVPASALDSEILTRTASEALQQAKDRGRNCIICDNI